MYDSFLDFENWYFARHSRQKDNVLTFERYAGKAPLSDAQEAIITRVLSKLRLKQKWTDLAQQWIKANFPSGVLPFYFMARRNRREDECHTQASKARFPAQTLIREFDSPVCRSSRGSTHVIRPQSS